jgi:acetyl esterase/lipase
VNWKVAIDDSMGVEEKYIEAIPSFWDLWHKTKLPQTSEKLFYRETENAASRIEFFRARGNSKKPAPFLMVVPGGSWGEADPSSFWELNSDLAESGIAVVSVSYRILPEFHWPAQREDLEAAIQYVRDHAEELNIDPNHWVILGRSAGGHIAESIAYEKPPLGLKGVISFYAPADLEFAYRYSKPDDILKTSILLNDFVVGAGHQATTKDFEQASPFNFVTSKSVPTLLFHAPRDPLVWVLQSERLQKKLIANNIPVTLIEIPWGTHGFDFNYSGPGSQLSTYTVHRFLNRVLR